ncbi:AfsR/SARP family transcriptional regulator [Nocardia mangyaensis]|uniref:AfsR/SARP family transcriptional regulator n=1 Tax=Nocardia mangyaensis TaxID=2213200 RepID=UPI00267671DE|nr:BTAD domain-containing putative transcriptional regulator [Nocardia mangyaensis]MDO3650088.1 BTAD domain-containing putative transcriptional regulator [Nocardia mangyaensis]
MSAQHLGPDGLCAATAVTSRIVVGVLGVIAIRRDDTLVALPGNRARLLLAALAVRPGRARSAPSLIDEVWGERPPRAPMNALHTQVSRLRAALPENALEIGPAGYRLTLPADTVDLTAATALVRRADEHLATGQTADSIAAIATARSLWRGEPGADLPDSGPAEDLRAAAEQLGHEMRRVELAAHTALGDLDTAVPLARAACTAQPLDETAHATLIRLLAAAGRKGEALEVFATYRLRLIEELGADPGPALLALHTAVLRGDPIESPAAGPFTRRDGRTRSVRSRNGADSTQVERVRADPASAGRVDGGSALAGRAGGGRAPARPLDDGSALGLRAAPNELLGRAADLDAIADMVRRSRVTTVLGPGGTGKTRVANAVGERLARSVPVVLVELAPIQAAGADARAEIESAIGHVMGLGEVVREPVGIRQGRQFDAGRRLREALAARPMLLILDNCEHLIDAAAEVVADLVGACAQLTVLTTSRSPLAITAETVYPLAPLAIDAAGSPATELFSVRARAVRPDARLDPDTVARLCRTLDGLPLAIELAAARVRTMSVAEIEAGLEHRFALLRSGDRSAPPRHRTLHAVIAWSWNLLEPDQQVVLRRLSRFAAGFTAAAAEIVAAGAQVPEMAAAVDGLAAQSLLMVLDDPDGAGSRYRMLETVREFGAEQLAAVDARTDGAESALVQERMACWAREFTTAAAWRYRTGDQVAAVLAVTAELDNLVAVLRAAIEHADAHTVHTVFPVAATVWVMRGAHLDFTGWAMRVATVPPPIPSPGLAADLQMITHLLTWLHLMFLNDGDLRLTATLRTRARRLLATDELDPGLRFLGTLISGPLTPSRLARLFADGVRSPEPHVRASALIARANFWENAGNVAGSTRDARQTLAVFEPEDIWGTALVCQHLAQLSGQSARYDEAVGYYRRAIELMGRLQIHDEVMEIRCYLAAALVGAGELEQARAELEFALRCDESGIRQVDDPAIRRNHRLAAVATAVAELELADGDIDAGLRHHRRALDLLGWPEFELTPGPGAHMVAAVTIDAFVLHGRAHEAADVVEVLTTVATQRFAQYIDLPQIGGVACAIGSYLLASGREVGLELLALATVSMARQDNPSMESSRHLALHRPTVGAAAIDRALRRAAGLRRIDAATRALELIGNVASASNPLGSNAGATPPVQARRI